MQDAQIKHAVSGAYRCIFRW